MTGLNLIAWTATRSDTQLTNTITSDAQAASDAGLNGTPALLIGQTGGTLRRLEVTSLTNPSPYASAIETLLRG